MTDCPGIIGRARVHYYAHLKQAAKSFTVSEDIHGVAICQEPEEDAFYLFGCNVRWESITDTWHRTVEEAMTQARFEHGNNLGKWVAAQQGVQRDNPAFGGPAR